MNLSVPKSLKEGVLVVSFGTSYEDTCQKTICAIEEAIQSSYPEQKLYRAWTSKFIIRKLKNSKGIQIDTVSEALERMAADGIANVVIQPTHLISGIEYDLLMRDIRDYCNHFQSICVGTPLLFSSKDCNAVVDILCKNYRPKEEEHLYILMGHGTEHKVDSVYQTINDLFRKAGRSDMIIGTVEGNIQITDVLNYAHSQKINTATLLPFMIVAGDHANNDMAGDTKNSWKNILAENNITSSVLLKGLGEYPEIREIFVEHCKYAQNIE